MVITPTVPLSCLWRVFHNHTIIPKSVSLSYLQLAVHKDSVISPLSCLQLVVHKIWLTHHLYLLSKIQEFNREFTYHMVRILSIHVKAILKGDKRHCFDLKVLCVLVRVDGFTAPQHELITSRSGLVQILTGEKQQSCELLHLVTCLIVQYHLASEWDLCFRL